MNHHTLLQTRCAILYTPAVYVRSGFSVSSHHWGLSLFFMLDRQGYHIVGLTHIFLMDNNVEHIFVCLFFICIFSSMKHLFMSFARILIGFLLMLSFETSYIFEMSVPCCICNLQVFFSIVCSLLILFKFYTVTFKPVMHLEFIFV